MSTKLGHTGNTVLEGLTYENIILRYFARREILIEMYAHREIKPNLESNYTFPIDLATNGIGFGFKSTSKVKLQSKFGLI